MLPVTHFMEKQSARTHTQYKTIGTRAPRQIDVFTVHKEDLIKPAKLIVGATRKGQTRPRNPRGLESKRIVLLRVLGWKLHSFNQDALPLRLHHLKDSCYCTVIKRAVWIGCNVNICTTFKSSFHESIVSRAKTDIAFTW